MFGSRRQMSATSVSAFILRQGCLYATILGFIWFGIESNLKDGSLVARNRYCYKWFCLLSRIGLTSYYCYVGIELIPQMDNSHLMILSWIRLFCCVICTLVILIIQFWYGQRVLRVVNNFLRLFRRVQALPGGQDQGFGGRRELGLLIFKLICMLYEFSCEVPAFFSQFYLPFNVYILCDMYTTINGAMICHVCFIGYLSIGALYAQVNRYVRRELRRQLRGLEQPNGVRATRQELKAAGYRLDECLAIYDEIQRVSSAFQQLIELPLSLIILFVFLSMTLASYYVMLNGIREFSMWLLTIKLFMDVVLLTLAIHGAGSSARVIRRLSLENCYVTERSDWHMRFETFLNRLNFYEFRVFPLGLFEISNELILVFLSGLVTYLTYVLQYGVQSNKI